MEKQIYWEGQLQNYSINTLGEVKNLKTNKIITRNNGYVQIKINGKSKTLSVAKILATLFLEKPSDNHIYATWKDDDKNNCNLENIIWITAKENSSNVWKKRIENGTTGAGQKRKKIQKNIVDIVYKTKKEEEEKTIMINGEETPFVIRADGRVRNLKTGNTLQGTILQSYRYINLRWDGKQANRSVHQLVALAFIENLNNYTIVDHINGDRLDNRVENLRWVSNQENSSNKHLDKTPHLDYKEIIYTDEELKEEEWKEYMGYMVSSLGRIKGIKGKLLKGSYNLAGYHQFTIGKKTTGHELVYKAFIGQKKDGFVINHIDGNKLNNRLSNLELVTHQENMSKAAIETNAWDFRIVEEFNDENVVLNTYKNASDAARAIGIQPGSMRNTIRRQGKCHNGLRYRYVK